MELLTQDQMKDSCEALAMGATRIALSDKWMQDPDVLARAEKSGFDRKTARHKIQQQLRKADIRGNLNDNLKPVWKAANDVYRSELRDRELELRKEALHLQNTLKTMLTENQQLLHSQGHAYFHEDNPAETKVNSVGEAMKALENAADCVWALLKLNAAERESIEEADDL